MEDTNQTPLLLESVDAAVSDDVHSNGAPSPVVEEDDLDLILWRMINDGSWLSGTDQVMGEQSEFPPEQSWRNPNNQAGDINMTCIAFAAILCSLVCFSMGFGSYKTRTIAVAMGSSVLIQPNRLFVETISVEQPSIDKDKDGPTIYRFTKEPPLVISIWSEEWMYFLNEGSQINISYSVISSSKLFLTIAHGNNHGYGRDYSDGYCYSSGQCKYDQSGLNPTLSWNIIQGNGIIQQNILLSGNYYITVENLNLEMEEVKIVCCAKVELNISGRALIYDTDKAYYMCKLARGRCVFPVLLLEENHVVLTTSQFNDQWHIQKRTSKERIVDLTGP
ncbi:E3 ubiquitin-protein ligase APD1-like [Helianthus annuus]|uniref:E3 ubiquitin-protein ligase APD1-like n=1 Tax=Helianthus annuus TaxID=4232 RepID=UPI000B900266|nr:E3 ubiquitin-protein ligase APD1-like [Helianthus annuus]